MTFNYYLTTEDDEKCRYAMVGYELQNTITENGYVSRGVCTIDENDYLVVGYSSSS